MFAWHEGDMNIAWQRPLAASFEAGSPRVTLQLNLVSLLHLTTGSHLSYLSHLQPGVDHALAHSDIPIVLKVTVSIAAGKGTEKWKHLAHFESNPIKGPTSLFTNYRYW